MGFTSASAALISCNRSLFKAKKILSLGNPYGSEKFFDEYLTKNQISALKDQPRNNRAEFLFKHILCAENFEILDISGEEGADHIADLNIEIKDKELDQAY